MTALLRSAVKTVCDLTRANEFSISLQRSDLLVLNYHGVLTQSRADSWNHGNDVDAASFRAQLQWLKQHLVPTDLNGVNRHSRGDWRDRKPPVLITFDDGYRNNLTIAAPILREEDVPAIFFLTTGYIGTERMLWNDEVRLRVRHWPEEVIEMPGGARESVPSDLQQRHALANKINRACKRLADEARVQYLELLRAKTSSLDLMADPESYAFMNWDEARQLAGMGFAVGSHTVEHPILSRLSRDRIAVELRQSKATIERELERPCTAIAYPNGSAQDVNDDVFEEVDAAGYEWAFMTTPVWQKPGGNPHQISRIGFPGHTDLATFKLYASGLHSRLSGIH